MPTVISNEEAAKNIAANVKRLLAAKGWSQRELARRTGDPHMSIVHVLSGDHIPNAGILARIAEALETTADALILRPAKNLGARLDSRVPHVIQSANA